MRFFSGLWLGTGFGCFSVSDGFMEEGYLAEAYAFGIQGPKVATDIFPSNFVPFGEKGPQKFFSSGLHLVPIRPCLM